MTLSCFRSSVNSLGMRRGTYSSCAVLGIIGRVILVSIFVGESALSYGNYSPETDHLTDNFEPISPVCEQLIDNFKNASTNYTRCIIENARSYARCQSCINEVIEVFKTYRLLEMKQNGSILCTETYPGLGEVLVFKHIHKFVLQSWVEGGCQNCFAWYSINAPASNELSNTTKIFQALSLQFYKCLFNDSYTGSYLVGSEDLLHHLREIGSNKSVCVRCMTEYQKLNRFYMAKFESMYDKDDIICVDIAGSMNFSRYVWQQVYGCHMEHVSVWPVVLTSVLLCCLPIAFYLAAKIFGRDVEPNVVPSKRLRGSLVGRISTSSDIHSHLLS